MGGARSSLWCGCKHRRTLPPRPSHPHTPLFATSNHGTEFGAAKSLRRDHILTRTLSLGLMWCAEYSIAKFFRRGEAVEFTAGPTGAALLVGAPACCPAPLLLSYIWYPCYPATLLPCSLAVLPKCSLHLLPCYPAALLPCCGVRTAVHGPVACCPSVACARLLGVAPLPAVLLWLVSCSSLAGASLTACSPSAALEPETLVVASTSLASPWAQAHSLSHTYIRTHVHTHAHTH